MKVRRLQVALIGCGQIADAHLHQIRRTGLADVVAVCDVEPLLARQAAERFGIEGQFTSVAEMLDNAKPDVVHLTTPVATHASLAAELLRGGAHVFVEKPFTTDADEARELLDYADRCNRVVCVGHDQLFDPIWLEARRLVAADAVGDVQHIESVLNYPIEGPFGSRLLLESDHWVRHLPGGLFQNTLSHPLYRITEFLTDAAPEVWSTWFRRLSHVPFPTELRAHLRGAQVTGALLFNSTVRPHHRLVRIYGTKACLEADLNAQVIRFDRPARCPGVFAKLETPLRQWSEAWRNLRRNYGRFCGADLHYFAGMRELFRRFYQCILDGTDPPIRYSEVIRVTELMDRIFEQCRASESDSVSRTGVQRECTFC